LELVRSKQVLDEERLQRNKKWLEDERVLLKSELGCMSPAMDDRERPGYGTHMADSASQVFEQTKTLAVCQRLRRTLEEVNRALEKMDKGIYRICDRCRGPIDPARLKALPYATLCKACQERLEVVTRPRRKR